MKNLRNFLPILQLAGLIFVVILVLFRKPTQVFKTSPTRVIKREIVHRKEEVAGRQDRITTIKNEITKYKTFYDTVSIVIYQDSLIKVQDTQIVKLTEIVKLQDTLVTKLEFDNKRLKRQRNIFAATTAILGAAVILK